MVTGNIFREIAHLFVHCTFHLCLCLLFMSFRKVCGYSLCSTNVVYALITKFKNLVGGSIFTLPIYRLSIKDLSSELSLSVSSSSSLNALKFPFFSKQLFDSSFIHLPQLHFVLLLGSLRTHFIQLEVVIRKYL